jgi:four helix bundle protein
MPERKRAGEDIAERIVALSRGVVALTTHLPPTPQGRHIAIQATRAVTGAGSNYGEARYAESRADFIHKVSVAAKEMGETLYWLRLIAALTNASDANDTLAREADELVAILVASAKTARARAGSTFK